MEITILEWLALQLKVKELSKDWELSIQTKMQLLALMEDLTNKLKPFMTIRDEVMAKYKSKNDEWKDVINMEWVNKDLTEASKSKIKLDVDSFNMEASSSNKILTAETIGVFKELYKDKFSIVTY